MALVERVADQMLLLDVGQCIATGTLAEVKAQLGEQQAYVATFANEEECQRARRALGELPGLTVRAPSHTLGHTLECRNPKSSGLESSNRPNAAPEVSATVEFALSAPEQLSPALQRLSARSEEHTSELQSRG